MVITDDAGMCKLSNRPLPIRSWCDFALNCISICSDSESKPSPRLCILKREEGESYGFHLRMEKGCQGHIIRNVASGGVADRCGLRDRDRLLEVNNCYVDDLSHQEVKAHTTTHYKVLLKTYIELQCLSFYSSGGQKDKAKWKPLVFSSGGWRRIWGGCISRAKPAGTGQRTQGWGL